MILANYTNGNTTVVLESDGTKTREIIDPSKPANPMHPESMDVKITNWCDAGCPYCHEMSTEAGKHADLDKLKEVLKVLPAGIELALGGGDPLSHPELISFLDFCHEHGFVVNLTVNQQHLERSHDLLVRLITTKRIYGLGISYSSKAYLKHAEPLLLISDNIVFHVIMGVNKLSDLDNLKELCDQYKRTCKVLVLGYKQYGFGLDYYAKKKNIEDNKYQWYIKLRDYLGKDGFIVSFDNLAITQLNLKRYFLNEETWKKFYMGDDFVFTMYIDAIEQQYAPSSTSKNRISFKDMTLLSYFQTHRNLE